MTKVLIDRELLERVRELLWIIGHRQDDYGVEAEHIGSLLKKVLDNQAQRARMRDSRVMGLARIGRCRSAPWLPAYLPSVWRLCRPT